MKRVKRLLHVCMVWMLVIGIMMSCSSAAGEGFPSNINSIPSSEKSNTCGNNLTWTLNKGILTISGTGEMDDYQDQAGPDGNLGGMIHTCPWMKQSGSIKKVVIEEGVQSIGSFSFARCETLESITFPKSLTSIGDCAFIFCKKLKEIDFTGTDSLNHIGSYAFQDCTSLNKITLPESLKSIAEGAFYHCTSLKKIVLPANLTSIASWTFGHCTNLKEIVLPESVSDIGEFAFYTCSSLAHIDLPMELTSIGKAAFHNCGLKDIAFPERLSVIGEAAFDSCASLTNIVFPESLTVIHSQAFGNCKKIQEITLPDSLSAVGPWTFWDCVSLKKVSLSESLESLETGAFAGCAALKEIVLPDSISTIVGNPFFDCKNLTKIIISPDHPYLTLIDGVLFDKDVKALLYYPSCLKSSSYTVPENVQRIGMFAFRGNVSLKSVQIPESVKNLNTGAFYECSSLTDITLPDAITGIGSYAFSECTKLKEIVLPDSLVWIDSSAFSDCKALSSIVLPSSLQYIYDKTFCNCTGLKTILLPDSIVGIGERVFSGCKALSEIKLPSSLIAIGDGAFEGCGRLQNIILPDSIYSIGNELFIDCTALKSITLPKSLVKIGSNALHNKYTENQRTSERVYTPIKEILVEKGSLAGLYCKRNEIPYGFSDHTTESISWDISEDGVLTVSGTGYMEDYFKQTPIMNKDGQLVTEADIISWFGSVEFSPFSDLYAGNTAPWENIKNEINSVVIEEGIYSIGNNAFQNCPNLKSVSLPESIICIGTQAFQECPSLKTITLPSSVISIEDSAFDISDSSDSQISAIVVPGSYAGFYCKQNGIQFVYADNTSDSVSWKLNDEGTLIISGNGYMDNYGSMPPWINDKDNIKNIVIEEGIYSISDYVFRNYPALTNVTLPESVLFIGENAFADNQTLHVKFSSPGSYAEKYCLTNPNVTYYSE